MAPQRKAIAVYNWHPHATEPLGPSHTSLSVHPQRPTQERSPAASSPRDRGRPQSKGSTPRVTLTPDQIYQSRERFPKDHRPWTTSAYGRPSPRLPSEQQVSAAPPQQPSSPPLKHISALPPGVSSEAARIRDEVGELTRLMNSYEAKPVPRSGARGGGLDQEQYWPP